MWEKSRKRDHGGEPMQRKSWRAFQAETPRKHAGGPAGNTKVIPADTQEAPRGCKESIQHPPRDIQKEVTGTHQAAKKPERY